MAVSDTDLATAEGAKRLVSELVSRDNEVVIYTGGAPLSASSPLAVLPSPLDDFEKIVVSLLWNNYGSYLVQTIELDAVDGAQGSAVNGTVKAEIDGFDGGFIVRLKGNQSTVYVSRIVGIRNGGGSALADLLAALGVVA